MMFLSVGKYKKLVIVADADGFNGTSLLVLLAQPKICDQLGIKLPESNFRQFTLLGFAFGLIETIKLHLSTR